ncbi:dipeptide/tripeptide permease [Streptococcus equinus]|uniref:Di-/tripeptide transporter n=2 Tax=Streptococcus equinus TaxID=1335 RepID=E8JM61_STREI|nr:di-/tripeptide transporter [Streptococcus equinus ATCC 9812]SUN56482.1 dipeptide/tripeptide permease [Streptococcus equinus]SUO79577.1 dipeptide/tripeptide permease [Streptococcus equinus]
MESMENNKIEQTFFGQPKALFTLFQTELWERFSYYGMRAILIYYLYASVTAPNAGLGLPKPQAMAIVSIYGALVYLSGIIGGWFADRVLGASQTIFIGGILITLGHIVLAVPFGLTSLFISLFFIILGTGMLKPNISNMVGHLYAADDPRRDTGFNIFVIGINIGSLLAPIVVGTVGQSINYHLGFSLAAIGMVLALFVYWFGRMKQFPELGNKPSNPMTSAEKRGLLVKLAIGLVICTVGGTFLYRANPSNFVNNLVNILSMAGIFIPFIYFFMMFTSKKVSSTERKQLMAYLPLFLSSIIFWLVEEQSATVIAVWGETRSNLHPTIFGMNLYIDPSWYQLLNPLFIVALTPAFVWLWNKMGERQPSPVTKFGLGLLLTGVSYLIMALPGILYGTDKRVSFMWLVIMFAVQMAGELLVSPVGLSVSTRLAPLAFQSQMVALWFLADSTSQAVNALITPYFAKETEVAFFGILGLVCLAVGVMLLFINKPVLKLMRNDK